MRRALLLPFLAVLIALAILSCGHTASPPASVPPIADAAAVQPRALSSTSSDGALDASPNPRASVLRYRGTNLSGGEFGACCPGRYGYDYGYPTHQDVDAVAARHMTFLRVPFRHARLQRALQTQFDATELARLSDVITYALSKGLSVAIEPHDSARYNGTLLTEVQMGDLWGRLARLFGQTPGVMFNLTNEPHDMPTETWAKLAAAGLREIRAVGALESWVLVPGNAWTGAAHWSSNWYGTSNAIAMLPIGAGDPRVAYEVHLYLDADGSGSGSECVSTTVGTERLANFTAWLKKNDRLALVGEIGAPNTPTCRDAVTRTLTAIESEPSYYLGWAWWSAGYRWTPNYQLSIQPIFTDAGLIEKPQVEWLRPFLYAPAPTPPPGVLDGSAPAPLPAGCDACCPR